MAASGLVRLAIILSLFSARCRAKKCALYSSDDPIVCLEGDEISKLVTNSETCWAVEFYSSWCGHCHHFAPTFKEVARDVTSEFYYCLATFKGEFFFEICATDKIYPIVLFHCRINMGN